MNQVNDWTANSQQMIRSQLNSTMSTSSLIDLSDTQASGGMAVRKLKGYNGQGPTTEQYTIVLKVWSLP